ncbi:hypothetical protein HPG69_016092 [Diceros bicornis minor]|uniref:Splicing factor U2AF 35 kDa subunit n=1 Tax=Diceros bicornis minor TaxID=77932 RepID=A0A7J7FIG3_DICBM|nr:hypothetical protein HPG69_016092 [Diceros bicornis minor]
MSQSPGKGDCLRKRTPEDKTEDSLEGQIGVSKGKGQWAQQMRQRNDQFFFSFTESTVPSISKLEHVVMETDALGCTINRPLARRHVSDLRETNKQTSTILIQNIYRNPQNSAQTADGSHCKSHSWRNFFKTMTIALLNIYRNPQNSSQSADGLRCAVSDVEMQEHYDEFFEEVFTEMEEKYGEVEEMNVCDNLGDHLVGNVYVKFRREEDAEKAVIDLNNRWFNGQPIHAELSPVTDFREACCRQYEMGECTRGGFCNFMHLKPISRELRRELYGRRRKK